MFGAGRILATHPRVPGTRYCLVQSWRMYHRPAHAGEASEVPLDIVSYGIQCWDVAEREVLEYQTADGRIPIP
jgi:hypothetical protein